VRLAPLRTKIQGESSTTPESTWLSRDNLDENGGGNQGLKRRPVAKS
jgi:hypothetical protein